MKRLFWLLVLLLLALYAGAHFAIRHARVRDMALRRLSEATGYRAEASALRFTPCLALSAENFRLSDASGAVFSAPWIRIGRSCRGWRVRAVRSTFRAVRGAGDGLWIPSQATGAETCPGACVFPRISTAFGKLHFDVSDAVFTFDSGDCTRTFAGVAWTRLPVRIPGHGDVVQNRLTWAKGPMTSSEDAEIAVGGSDEWYELDGSVARFEKTLQKTPAEQAAPAAQEAAPASPAEPDAAPAAPAAPATQEVAPEAAPDAPVPPAVPATPEAVPEAPVLPAATEVAPEATPAAPVPPAAPATTEVAPATPESPVPPATPAAPAAQEESAQ